MLSDAGVVRGEASTRIVKNDSVGRAQHVDVFWIRDHCRRRLSLQKNPTLIHMV